MTRVSLSEWSWNFHFLSFFSPGLVIGYFYFVVNILSAIACTVGVLVGLTIVYQCFDDNDTDQEQMVCGFVFSEFALLFGANGHSIIFWFSFPHRCHHRCNHLHSRWLGGQKVYQRNKNRKHSFSYLMAFLIETFQRQHTLLVPLMVFLAFAAICDVLSAFSSKPERIVSGLMMGFLQGYFFVVACSIYETFKKEMKPQFYGEFLLPGAKV